MAYKGGRRKERKAGEQRGIVAREPKCIRKGKMWPPM